MSKIGYVYKIVCSNKTVTDCYVGSTNDIEIRRKDHKSKCNNPNSPAYNKPLYKFIRDNDGWDNFTLKKIKTVHYDNKIELLKKERHWVEKLEASLNKRLPSRTKKEYYKQYREINKEAIREQNKQYREANKEAINKYREEHKEAIREQNKQYYADNKEAINKYREEHKEAIRARDRQYYADNKVAILAKKSEKHDCPCGCQYTRANKARHERSKKHQTYLSSQSNTPNTSNYNSDSDSD